MDVQLPLSATIKVVKMEHKKKKITMGFALLVCAMVALVGVGYALAYQGSATVPVKDTSAETLTVSVSNNTGIFASSDSPSSYAYAVNTENNGEVFTLSGLTLTNGSDSLTPSTIMNGETPMYFHYSDGHIVLDSTAYSEGETHYVAYEVGSAKVSIRQTPDATVVDNSTQTTVALSITNAPSTVEHQYGFSLVYVKDNALYSYGNQNVILTGTEHGEKTASLTMKAYLIYSETVPVGSYDSITGISIAPGSPITFTASVPSA